MLTKRQEERLRDRRIKEREKLRLRKTHILIEKFQQDSHKEREQKENKQQQWRNRSAKYYATHRETANDKFKARRKQTKLEAIKYKGNRCSMCGYDRCSAALEFHHMDPSKKDAGIANLMMKCNFELLKPELDKCILLCSNCHRETHANQ